MAIISLNTASGGINLIPEDGSGTANITIPRAGFGKVLQVLSTTKVDSFSTSSNSFVDVTGLSVTITPSSANSKILVMASFAFSSEGSTWGEHYFRIARNGTGIKPSVNNSGNVSDVSGEAFGGLADDDGHRTQMATIHMLDEPSTTSSLTYSVQASCSAVANYGNLVYVNNSAQRSTSYSGDGISTITVMEISGG